LSQPETPIRERTPSAHVEKLGAFASIVCAIHCAALPILIGAGAAGAVSWLNDERVEWGMVLLAAVVGTVSAWRGFRSHGNKAVAVMLVVAAIGLVILTAQHSGHAGHAHDGAWLSAVFGIALGGSLLVNRRMCNACSGCEHEHG
jgi:MerC mercury resistance protein